MSRAERILYASTNHPWAFGWTFYQMAAEALARDRDVVYVDTPASVARAEGRRLLRGARSEPTRSPRLRVVRTPALPFQRTEAARRAAARLTATLVARWARRAGFQPEVVWTYTPYELALAERFPAARLLYWTGDEVVIPGEERLLERADLVLCVSDPVFEQHRARWGEKVRFVPVACDFERYRAATPDAEVQALPRPVVGYSGWISRRLDLEAVGEVADALHEGTLVLVGPTQGLAEIDLRPLQARPNVRLLGAQAADRVPQLIAAFDVALLPLADNRFNRRSNPVKFYEYLALGKPVVATDVSVTLRRYAGIASLGPRETLPERTLAAAAANGDAEARVAVAQAHSFDALIACLEELPL